jgi:hypothetical protein
LFNYLLEANRLLHLGLGLRVLFFDGFYLVNLHGGLLFCIVLLLLVVKRGRHSLT